MMVQDLALGIVIVIVSWTITHREHYDSPFDIGQKPSSD